MDLNGLKMKNSFLTRREEIVLTTIDLMDELGIANVSMKEIAKRENVTDAALYKHFRSKEEIFLKVFEYYVRYDSYIFHTVEAKKGSFKEKIFTYFQLYAVYYDNYHAITSILGMYEVLLYNGEFARIVKETVGRRNRFLMELLEKGLEEGEFERNVTPENMAYILSGAFEKIIYMWRLERYQFSLKEKAEGAVGELLELYDKKVK